MKCVIFAALVAPDGTAKIRTTYYVVFNFVNGVKLKNKIGCRSDFFCFDIEDMQLWDFSCLLLSIVF